MYYIVTYKKMLYSHYKQYIIVVYIQHRRDIYDYNQKTKATPLSRRK